MQQNTFKGEIKMDIDNQVVNSRARVRWIKMVQKQLIRENPSALPNHGVDGKYGPETVDWVTRFQERKGIQVDGIAGPETLGRLRNDILQRPNTSGRGVEILQEDLLFFYIQQSAVDGEYGPGTMQGVRDFQFLNNLVVDGIAGPITLKKMDELLTTILVQNGDTGSLVRRIQHQLNDQESVDISIEVDGSYGPATENAVKKFQEALDQRVDGIVGPVTMNLLDLQAVHPLSPELYQVFFSIIGKPFNTEEITDASEIDRLQNIVEENSVFQNEVPESDLGLFDVGVGSFGFENGTKYYHLIGAISNTITVQAILHEDELESLLYIEVDGDQYESNTVIKAFDIDGEIVIDEEDSYLELTNADLELQKEMAEIIQEVIDSAEYSAQDIDWGCEAENFGGAAAICYGGAWVLGFNPFTGVAALVAGTGCMFFAQPIIANDNDCTGSGT